MPLNSYTNPGIRKGVLLAIYSDFLQANLATISKVPHINNIFILVKHKGFKWFDIIFHNWIKSIKCARFIQRNWNVIKIEIIFRKMNLM